MDDVSRRERSGLYIGLLTFIIWGLAPIYFKQLTDVSAWLIIAHRVIWSFFFVLLIMLVLRKKVDIRRIIASKKLLLFLLLSTLLIGFNWLLYTWAVINNFILETSLGYFINPLVNILFGLIFFKDKLRNFQYLAIALAAVGVCYQIIMIGKLPLIALALAFSFAFYGLIRKMLPVDALNGLLIETAVLMPLAVLYVFIPFMETGPTSQLFDSTFNYWLLAAGVVTTVPLALFTIAAKRLALSTIGFLQFIAPSLSFIIAITLYEEPFNSTTAVTFGFIWLALAIYCVDNFRHSRKMTRSRVDAAEGS